MSDRMKTQWLTSRGVQSAAAAAFLLGLAPVFGKAAIEAGLGPFALVAARTVGAMLLLFGPGWFKAKCRQAPAFGFGDLYFKPF